MYEVKGIDNSRETLLFVPLKLNVFDSRNARAEFISLAAISMLISPLPYYIV